VNIQRGARPIRSQAVLDHYRAFEFNQISLEHYVRCWRQWITASKDKTLLGLEQFSHADFVNGTSQTFDHFWLRHRHRHPVALKGEFQYHACVNRPHGFRYVDSALDLDAGDCLVISAPFSDYGCQHPDWTEILNRCDQLAIPVCLDMAYWGISQGVHLDLSDRYCVQQITCSLSKPFWTLENHRIGVRFSRDYNNDGISMINEVQMQNIFSMSLAVHFMQQFDCDWISDKFRSAQIAVCEQLELTPAPTMIFGHGGDQYHGFNRGISGNNRVCISEYLNDIKENTQ
jgi:hypothetical protein